MTTVTDRLARIRWLLCDVDGVLTSGELHYGSAGERAKIFHAQDGHLIKVAIASGIGVGLVSGRDGEPVRRRAKDLGLDPCFLAVGDKVRVVEEWLSAKKLTWQEVGFVGDDLPDLACMRKAGVGWAVANAQPGLRRYADVVTRRPGGTGAVAEIVEQLLRSRGQWSPDRGRMLHG